MVDDHYEGACGILSPKASPIAMASASTDYFQELDAASTPEIAPATPMQAWQKPQQARESSDAVPSLFLGIGSEVKGALTNLNMPHTISHMPMPVRCGLVDLSTSSRLPGRIQKEAQKEGPQCLDKNLPLFCLSKYEKKYQTVDAATPLHNQTLPSSLLSVRAHAGHMNMPWTDVCRGPHGHAAHSGTQGFCTGFKVLLEGGPLHEEEPEKKVCSTPTCVATATNNKEVDDSSALYSPAPGEVAHDAYELYSKMFPSIHRATPVIASSSIDAELPSPFLEHMDDMQLLPSACRNKKPFVQDRSEVNFDHLLSGKKIKSAKIKEEDKPGGFHDVKQELVFYEPCGTVDVKVFSMAPCHGDTKPVQMPSESLSKVLHSHNSDKVVHTFDHSEGCAGHGSAEVMSVQPAAGLKLFTSSAYANMPNTSIVTAGESLVSLLLEPSSTVRSKTLLQGRSSTDADWGRYLALSARPSGNTETAIMPPFQQRFKELQAFLKQCDDTDQHECIQALGTLSAVARSSYAVDLETRAIRLSLEEGKEMKRMRLLNVFGKVSEGSVDDAGATPYGPRLPAPGAVMPLPEHAQ